MKTERHIWVFFYWESLKFHSSIEIFHSRSVALKQKRKIFFLILSHSSCVFLERKPEKHTSSGPERGGVFQDERSQVKIEIKTQS